MSSLVDRDEQYIDFQDLLTREPKLLDFLIQPLSQNIIAILQGGDAHGSYWQSDPHQMPIENASVVWPEILSPYIKVATVHIPAQKFDSAIQLVFARNLSYNPWHCIADHRPLGNQNRARKYIYLETSKFRQQMNEDKRIEPQSDWIIER